MNPSQRKKKWLMGLMITVVVIALAGGYIAWRIFTDRFTNTAERVSVYSVSAGDFIKEFEMSETDANEKYREKIISVRGKIKAIENVDTTVNVKMTADSGNAYIIFAFQTADQGQVRKLTPGQDIVIKGSCSGGVFSEILETTYISFKRCVISN